MDELKKQNEYLKDLLKQFFELLDREHESDNGRVYNPVTINCSSVLCTRPLAELLNKMKEASK